MLDCNAFLLTIELRTLFCEESEEEVYCLIDLQSGVRSLKRLIARRSAVKSCEAYKIKAFKLTEVAVPRAGWVRAARRRRRRSMIECVEN